MIKKFQFSRLDTIGAADAEGDNFLVDCFVDNGYLSHLYDTQDHRFILLGRTGSGKSALLLKMLQTHRRTLLLKPENLSLTYISNSTILKFLLDLDVNLDLFFKLLWRHVLAVELLKHHFSLNSQKEADSWFQTLRNKLSSDKRNQDGLKYLEKWGSSFWKETDYRVKEITESFATNIKAKIISLLPSGTTSLDSNLKLEKDQKAEIQYRIQHIVSEIHMDELTKIMELINKIFDDPQKPYFVVIDRLDEDWIEDKLRYKLIRSLIETAKEYRSIENVKTFIALRQDLLTSIFYKTRSAGFQPEKYESLCINIEWTKEDLKILIDKRISELAKNKDVSSAIDFQKILPKSINRDENPVEYILDRTLLRPRDAIAFLNFMIKRADKKSQFTATIIKDAEEEYSTSRINALVFEWFSEYPNIYNASKILRGKPSQFNLEEITENDLIQLYLRYEDFAKQPHCQIFKLVQKLGDNEINYDDFRVKLIRIFYLVGLIGIKSNSWNTFVFSIDSERAIQKPEINQKVRFLIHKAFWRNLGIS